MSYSAFEQNTLLVDSRVFDRAARNKFKNSYTTYVAVPALAYRYEVKTDTLENDFISRSVCALNDYYKVSSQNDIVSLISKDLGLSKTLVKAIIANHELLKSEIEAADDNSAISTNRFMVFYDLISRSFMPLVLPCDKYEEYKDDTEDRSHYRRSIGDSKLYRIQTLSVPGMYSGVPYQPNESDVASVLHDKAPKIKRKNALWSISYTGVSEYVDIVTSVYYDKNNVVDYCVEHPFFPGRAGWLAQDIEIAARNNTSLSEQLRKMRDSVDLDTTQDGVRKNGLWLDCEEYVEQLFGKDKIVLFPELKSALIQEIVNYTKLVHLYKNERSMNQARFEESKKDYFVAVFSLMEKMFAHSFLINFDNTKISQYREILSNIETDSYCLYDYRKMAEEIGFDKEYIPDRIKIYISTISFLINNQSSNADVHSILFANLIEAKASEDHPFYQLADQYTTLFDFVEQARTLRNPSKHGSKDEIIWNNYDLQKFVINLFETLVMKTERDQLDSNKFIDYADMDEEYQAIDKMADSHLTEYEHIWRNQDAYNYAMALERSLLSEDAEYYSKASNLLQEVLKQFAYQITEKNAIESRVLNRYLPADFTSESVVISANAVLAQYETKSRLENNEYNVDGFKKSFIAQLTTGNLLIYLIFATDYYKTEVFKELLSRVPDMIQLVQNVLNNRRHNAQADFKNNRKEIKGDHEQILSISNSILDLLELIGEERT